VIWGPQRARRAIASGQRQAPLNAAADDRFAHADVVELAIELATKRNFSATRWGPDPALDD
jgi:hypothetical protein